jgi:hypothetical protein
VRQLCEGLGGFTVVAEARNGAARFGESKIMLRWGQSTNPLRHHSSMIQLAGSSHRSYLFPADLPAAFAYYGDLARSMRFLPHISIVERYAPDQLRLLYSAIDGLYRVRIYCDVLITIDQPNYRLRIGPLTGHRPVKNEVGLNAMTCQGHYDSESTFSAAGHQTQIEAHLNLRANVPMPLTLRLIPSALISGAAHNILHLRTAEITSSFIEQSLRAYSREPGK